MAYRSLSFTNGGNNSSRHGVFNWLTRLSIYNIVAMLVMLVFIFIVVTLIFFSTLTGLENGGEATTDTGGAKPEYMGRSLKKSDLRFQIDELKRIKFSVSNELRDLESKRQRLYTELNNYTGQIDELKLDHQSYLKDIDGLKLRIDNMRLAQEEFSRKNMPDIQAPKRILPSFSDGVKIPAPNSAFYCRVHNCFDFSRCSLTSQFPVYFYNPGQYVFSSSATSEVNLEKFVKFSVSHAIESSPHVTFDANIACLYIVLIGDTEGGLQYADKLQENLYTLPHWRGDGRNHVLLNIARSYSNRDVFAGVDIGRAMVAQSTFLEEQYRGGFDVIVPPTLGIPHGQVWNQLPALLPARRKHLLTFQGQLPFLSQYIKPPLVKATHGGNSTARNVKLAYADIVYHQVQFEKSIVEVLKKMQVDYAFDHFNFEFSCDSERIDGYDVEWSLCGPDSVRHDLLKQSTFSLIIAPLNSSLISTTLLQTRVYESFKFGAIPVILGNYVKLPFEDLISSSLKRAVISLPKPRVTELHYFLRSITDPDVVEFRRQGRIIWETHMGTTKNIVDTLLADLRTRINIPAFPVKEEPSPSVFNASFVPIKEEIQPDDPQQPEGDDDFLGPIEDPYPSARFGRNFTFALDGFSRPGDSFHQFPSSPFDPVLPSEAKFLGSSYGFRPINEGAGGAGKEFSEALGGNWPREQFTIVMLTYERDSVMTNAVARLKGLPHLNKVVVVWNSPRPPADQLRWPDIHVPVQVVKTRRNSLNNRFLPYDAIETDAVLSIDDDAHLRHDEIIFGFRVWRENRDRLVGFPGRFHAWDVKHQGWNYNSNYSCELSMVLTGAAFFHKYYSYLYSYVMPQAIRDKVDEYLNCEDLAMNFLVSHITRKPPVKVTSRWTFRCPGCPVALSVDEEHFLERHKCMNFFVSVYGYMPLLYTQYRVDSVLFKTRIPHDKQKCFKYI